MAVLEHSRSRTLCVVTDISVLERQCGVFSHAQKAWLGRRASRADKNYCRCRLVTTKLCSKMKQQF